MEQILLVQKKNFVSSTEIQFVRNSETFITKEYSVALQPSLRESYGRNLETFNSVSETHFKKFNDATNNFRRWPSDATG